MGRTFKSDEKDKRKKAKKNFIYLNKQMKKDEKINEKK